MNNNNNFNKELFLIEENYEESPLVDRKQYVDLITVSGRVEFVKDIISLANSMRLFGKPAYLLLGISNKNPALVGVGKIFSDFIENFREESPITINYWEELSTRISRIIERNIYPPLVPSFCHGMIDQKPLAYIEIFPQGHIHKKIFTTKENYKSGKSLLLEKGQSWIRIGENKSELTKKQLTEDTEPFSYSYSEVPYLLPSNWKQYFFSLLHDKSMEVLNRIKNFQDIYLTSGKLLNSYLDEYMENNEQLLVISGNAGCGKSVAVKRWIQVLAETNFRAALESIKSEEYQFAPPEYIPVYFPLLGQPISNSYDLSKVLLNKINKIGSFWNERPNCPEKLLEYKKLKWLFILDGLDEIWTFQKQNCFLSILHVFMDRFPNVKIVLTTRPLSSNLNWHDWGATLVELQPLTPEQIKSAIQNIFPEGYKFLSDGVLLTIETDIDLFSIFQIPLNLPTGPEELFGSPVFNLNPIGEKQLVDIVEIRKLEKRDVNIPSNIVANTDDLTIENPFTNEFVEQKEPEENLNENEEMVEEKGNDENLVQFSKSIFLKGLYNRLWIRETERWHLPGHYRWRETGKLAVLEENNFPIEAATRYLHGEKALLWCLGLGIIKNSSSLGWFCFFTKLTKIMFIAFYLEELIENCRHKEFNKSLEKISSDLIGDVFVILQDLQPNNFNELIQKEKYHDLYNSI